MQGERHIIHDSHWHHLSHLQSLLYLPATTTMSTKDAEAGKHDYSVDVKEASIHHHTGLEGTLRDETDTTGVVRGLKARHIQLIGELATLLLNSLSPQLRLVHQAPAYSQVSARLSVSVSSLAQPAVSSTPDHSVHSSRTPSLD